MQENKNDLNADSNNLPTSSASGSASGSPMQDTQHINATVSSSDNPMIAAAETTPTAQTVPITRPKRSRWKIFSIIMAILTIVPIVFFVYVMSSLIRSANNGDSGTEFVGLALFMTVVPFVGLMMLINFIAAIIYLIRRRPRGKLLILPGFVIVVAILAIGYVLYAVALPLTRMNIDRREALQRSHISRRLSDQAAGDEVRLTNLFRGFGTIRYQDIMTDSEKIDYDNPVKNDVTYIRLGQDISGTLRDAETSVYGQLSKSGFRRDGAEGTFHYVFDNSPNIGKGYVVVRYTNGKEVIAVQYYFDKKYGCPTGYVCQFTEENQPDGKRYSINNFGPLPVTEFQARYSAVPNRYTGFSATYY